MYFFNYNRIYYYPQLLSIIDINLYVKDNDYTVKSRKEKDDHIGETAQNQNGVYLSISNHHLFFSHVQNYNQNWLRSY